MIDMTDKHSVQMSMQISQTQTIMHIITWFLPISHCLSLYHVNTKYREELK